MCTPRLTSVNYGEGGKSDTISEFNRHLGFISFRSKTSLEDEAAFIKRTG